MGRALDSAVVALQHGGLVVYPTDTLVGLGARAGDRRAVKRVLELKQRPPTTPIAISVSSLDEIEAYAELSESARGWIRTNLPGPWTVIVRATRRAGRRFSSPIVAADLSIGVRIPDHAIARELARKVGPITCTSVNRHGAPPCRTVSEARRIFGPQVTNYVDVGAVPSGRPSTIIDLRGVLPKVRDRR